MNDDLIKARVKALRDWRPVEVVLPQWASDALPKAKLAAGLPARIGLLNMIGIGETQYHRELAAGTHDVFRLGPGAFALEIDDAFDGCPYDLVADDPEADQ
ncbi:MAG: hypothetical protein RLZ51_2385 [Pseudomonadota bacterium]|jgi:hypothetical protein